MKKNLLFATALFCSIVMSAQSTWTCITSTDDGKAITGTANIKGSTTESNIDMFDITWGAGVKTPSTCQKTYKDIDGTTQNYAGDGEALIKWVPTTVNGGDAPTIKEIEPAYAAGQYVEFGMEINNIEDFFKLGSLKFDAARLGTDAVRLNVRIIGTTTGSGDDGYDSGWLINEDNWSTIAGGIGDWTAGEIAEGDVIPGYRPSREDATRDFSGPEGVSKLEIPLSFLPEDIYGVKARIVFYGIADNKALALRNVSFTNADATGIKDIVTVDESVAVKYYTVSGIEVKEPVKGINIVKQTMTDGSVKYIKEVR